MFTIKAPEKAGSDYGTNKIIIVATNKAILNSESIQPKEQKLVQQQVVPLKDCICKDNIMFEIY